MLGDNLASVELTEEQIAAIRTAISTLEETANANFLSLTADQKKDLPKAATRRMPLVNRVAQLIETHPQFAPAYMDSTAFKVDVNATNVLTEFRDRLTQVIVMINDTIMLSNSEAFQAALHYYNNVKQQARANVPGTQLIYDDLKVFYSRTSTTSAATE